MTNFYKASRWDPLLILITLVLCIGSVSIIIFNPDPITILGLGIIIISAFFHTVLGYSLANQKLVIHRIGRNHKIDIADLEDVEFKNQMVSSSWKLIGKGGLFAWLGASNDKTDKSSEIYATNKNNCVVLNLKTRQIFISPSDAKGFVNFAQQHVAS